VPGGMHVALTEVKVCMRLMFARLVGVFVFL